MAKPVQKVELGFDESATGNWFTLDSATRGLLDNTTYTLSGAAYYDVTQYVTSIQSSRGKNRELDRFNAGHIVIQFNNKNRYFDPTYAASPFYGQIVPRRDVRVSANGVTQFVGVSDDWNLIYTPDGNSEAEVSAYDGFAFLSQQTLAGGTATSQLSGARINAVLSDPGVNWSPSARAIDAGQQTLQADVIAASQDVVGYINLIEQTEPGIFYIDKTGKAVFKDRNSALPTSAATILADDGTGINYSSVKVIYGSELLYNQAELTRLNGGTATANDYTSQAAYGVRTYTASGLLHDTDASMANLAAYLVGQYSQPEFRFEAVEINLTKLSTTDQNTILGLEIGSICKIIFTPNGITPSISKYAEVIAISHNVSYSDHNVVLGFQTLEQTTLILDDIAVGLLDYNSLGY
jgi:hypothetical protein